MAQPCSLINLMRNATAALANVKQDAFPGRRVHREGWGWAGRGSLASWPDEHEPYGYICRGKDGWVVFLKHRVPQGGQAH